MDAQVTCPNCRSDFPIDKIMSAQLAVEIRAEYENEFSEKTRVLMAEREETAALRKKLETSQQQVDKQVQKKVAAERKGIEADARVAAQQVVAVELKDQKEQISETAQKLKSLQTNEIELLKKNRKLEEQAEQQDLEVARQVDEERKKIRAAALTQAQEQNQLKLAEKDLAIDSMRKKIDELVLKAEQGSQQLQGEVQELALESMLPAEFPGDVIKPVAKGIKGADVLQHVYDKAGRDCGTILWESKRTKTWSDKWLSKVIDDQQEAKASCVCIVTAAMPESVQYFEEINGVWIANWSCAKSAAMALRRVLIESARARRATEGQHDKMELVYNYIHSSEFSNRVRGVVKPYIEMQAGLEKEKRAITLQWNKRQKQLDQAITSTVGLFGDLQGIMGSGLQEIEEMDILALETDG